jgi:hypothetical protein
MGVFLIFLLSTGIKNWTWVLNMGIKKMFEYTDWVVAWQLWASASVIKLWVIIAPFSLPLAINFDRSNSNLLQVSQSQISLKVSLIFSNGFFYPLQFHHSKASVQWFWVSTRNIKIFHFFVIFWQNIWIFALIFRQFRAFCSKRRQASE